MPDDLKGKMGYCKLKKGSTNSHSVNNSLWKGNPEPLIHWNEKKKKKDKAAHVFIIVLGLIIEGMCVCRAPEGHSRNPLNATDVP